jgi:hypothetical protein
MGKATNLDQPLQNLTRAQDPLQDVGFDVSGPCKQASFAGLSYCSVLVFFTIQGIRGSLQSGTNWKSLMFSKVSMLKQL